MLSSFMLSNWNVQLVVLSIFIGVLGSFIALDSAGRMRSANGNSRKFWFFLGILVMGLAIWSMHFVGMLALVLPFSVFHDLKLSVVSMLAAIIGSGIAFSIISHKKLDAIQLVTGGIAMGLAIACMHYIGMASMVVPAKVQYDLSLFVLSIISAILSSMGALWLAFKIKLDRLKFLLLQKAGSALLMGFAIAGLFYIGMAAAHFTPFEDALQYTQTIPFVGPFPLTDILIIAAGVFAVALLILTSQSEGERQKVLVQLQRRERQLSHQLNYTNVITSNLGEGVYAIDTKGCITFLNAAAEQMLGWKEQEVIGKPIHGMIHYKRPNGLDFPVDECQLIKVVETGSTLRNHEDAFITRDGRFIDVSCISSPIIQDGEIKGAVLAFRDVTELKQVQQNIRASEAKFRQVFSSNIIGILYCTLDGQITDANTAFLNMVGYTRDEMERGLLRWNEITPPGYEEKDRKIIEKMLAGEVINGYEKQYLHKDGHHVDVLLGIAMLDGSASEAVAFVQDITQEKQAKQALLESESRFRRLSDSNLMGIVFWDAQGNLSDANEAYLEMMGYTREDLREGKVRWLELSAPESVLLHEDGMKRALAGESLQPYEARFIRKDGRYIDTLVGYTLLEGTTENGIAFLVDITQRKQMEIEVKYAKAEAEATNALLAIISKAQSRFITSEDPWQLFDEFVQDLLKLTQSQFGYIGEVLYKEDGKPYLIFRGLTNIAWSHETQALYEQLTTVGLEFHNLETLYGLGLKNDGSVIISNNPMDDPRKGGLPAGHPPLTAFIGLPIYSQGVLVGQIGLANRVGGYTQDIVDYIQPLLITCGNIIEALRNDKRRLEAEEALRQLAAELEQRVIERTAQLQAVNKELEAFSYSVSHDLRSPLRTIDGFSQAVLEFYGELLDERGKDYLQRVRNGTQQMGQLIDDMLNLSRLTRGEMEIQTDIDLSGMVEGMAQELQHRNPERNADFIIEKGLTVNADKRLLKAALQNLLDNAWKFTGKKPRAMIEFGRTEYQGKNVFFIKDNGAGFDMKYAHKMFGAFQRLHAITEFSGTGVGLATVQRIIHRHGGEIWAEGTPDEGATFYFTLNPVDKTQEEHDGTAQQQNYSVSRG